MLLTAYAIAITLAWIIVSIYFIIGTRSVGYLENIRRGEVLPSLTIIIPVRNEETELQQALTSVLNIDYPGKEIIVINDRSTDGTAAILERMILDHPGLKMLTIDQLESGWLGKNHALYKGYLQSSSEWILFTDADVNFSRYTMQKSMTYAIQNNLDHLCIVPQITTASPLFRTVLNTFALILEFRQRPWSVSNPNSTASIGIGAFNLVRRTAYERAGTHKAFSLRPDDDLKLGEQVKRSGGRQDVLYGDREVSLQWYKNLSEFIRGLMKNTFSISQYNLLRAFFNALLAFLILVLPVPLLVLSGYPHWVSALLIVIAQTALMLFRRGIKAQWYDGFMIWFSGAIMVYIVIASAIRSVRQGGIYWRDSFYQLKELKKQN